MKNLHFRDNFKNFLFDYEEFISVYEGGLHVFNYQKLIKLSPDEIIFKTIKKKVIINGIKLKIKQMSKQELLITGEISKVEFVYEI